MNLSFHVFSSYKELPSNWDALLGQNNSLCVHEIALVEKAAIANTKNYYVLTYRNEEPVLVSYFQLLQVKPYHFNETKSWMQKTSLTLALQLVKPTLLVAGNLYRHDVTYYHSISGTASDKEIAILYEKTIQYVTEQTKCSGIFVKDIDNSIAIEFEKDSSYKKMDNDISMYMQLPSSWNTLADYEKALKHKYVQRCKKTRKSFQEVTIKNLTLEEIITYEKRIEELYLQVTNKQLVSMGILNKDFFVELKKTKQENYLLHGFFLHDKLIAFSSAIVHGAIYDMNYIGIDYTYNQQYSLYFNILFHCLENAILLKAEKLVLGRTAPEAKAILGCKPEHTHGFYKLRNAIVNWFFSAPPKISVRNKEMHGKHVILLSRVIMNKKINV